MAINVARRCGAAQARQETVMADVINLNRFRKKRARDTARKTAAEHRVRFGRDQGDRVKTQREAEKATKDLDDKRLE